MVNQMSVLLKNFVINGQMSASNPLLHKNANRYFGFTGKIYPEHLVLKQDLHDFEDYI